MILPLLADVRLARESTNSAMVAKLVVSKEDGDKMDLMAAKSRRARKPVLSFSAHSETNLGGSQDVGKADMRQAQYSEKEGGKGPSMLATFESIKLPTVPLYPGREDDGHDVCATET